MKVCLIQPPYSTDYSKSDEYFKIECELLSKCDKTMDIIVLPEMADMPCLCKTKEERLLSFEKYNDVLIKKVKETAKKCQAIIFVNARYKTEKGYRNTTYAVDQNGEIRGLYFKKQLVPNEMKQEEMDISYQYEFENPTVIEIDGIRFGFLTCYDFYFYENYANMARCNLDVIIGCSHQRSDTHDAIEITSRFLAYNTNSYVLRSSVSMGQNSDVGGGSMVVAPDGKVLLNMKSQVGIETVDIDILKKYYKPAGFGNPPSAHYEYIEKGRRPWKYRHGGCTIVPDEDIMPYPRICAQMRKNTFLPENSIAAFGAAIALGVDEIDFDLWSTKDGVMVSISNPLLSNVSNGSGYVYDCTYEELLKYDFGIKYSSEFAGLKIVTFEEVLRKFACNVIMNIHLKTKDNNIMEELKKAIQLVKKYDCLKHVCFMLESDDILKLARELFPEIIVGFVITEDTSLDNVENIIEHDCKKIQFFTKKSQTMIDVIRKHNISCCICSNDDFKELIELFNVGADTVITNKFNLLPDVIKNVRGKI